MGIAKDIRQRFGNVHAACRYGSSEAGYSTDASDIDVIVVMDRFKDRIRYIYEGRYSFLVVSKRFLLEDAEKIKHGDFVAARFCNPISPVKNPAFIRSVELAAKKRIILHYLKRLIYTTRMKAYGLEINLLYFPFTYWNQLARIYPPYRYSIENTLRDDLRERNIRRILPGYLKAIKDLKVLIEIYPGWYKIAPGFLEKVLRNKSYRNVYQMFEREVQSAIERYRTHKMAGKGQSKDVILYEITHKLEREMQQIKRKRFRNVLDDPGKYINKVPTIK